jgi:hypothetical protein
MLARDLIGDRRPFEQTAPEPRRELAFRLI